MKKLNIPKKAKRKPPEKPRPYLDCVAVEGCKVTFSPHFWCESVFGKSTHENVPP
jgi:hypothetical protein